MRMVAFFPLQHSCLLDPKPESQFADLPGHPASRFMNMAGASLLSVVWRRLTQLTPASICMPPCGERYKEQLNGAMGDAKTACLRKVRESKLARLKCSEIPSDKIVEFAKAVSRDAAQASRTAA